MIPFIGSIMMFGFNFPPNGWALCQGQLLSIQQNTALFSLLGTTYGGNGTTTFALPDLRGRSPIGRGQGPGLSDISQGEVSGTENVTLLTTNMIAGQANNFFAAANTANGSMGGVTATLAPAGNNQPFGSRNPYLGLNFSIALEGIFPSRN